MDQHRATAALASMTDQERNFIWLVVRRMRTPLVLLIVVLAISVLGMVLIPGVDAQGQPYRLSFLEALYFVAFMSTTIGFGEIPQPFTSAQRLWVLSVIFLNVSVWIYAIGSILSLLQDRRFQRGLERYAFARRVRRLRQPFFLLCGMGESGQRVATGLDRMGYQVVGLEINEQRLDEFSLSEPGGRMPLFTADAGEPRNLVLAGLLHPRCRGVVALTNDDTVNLAVAVTAKLHREALPVHARCESRVVAANLASFDTDNIVEPYHQFARFVRMAFQRPATFQLHEWLVRIPGEPLQPAVCLPRGRWVICGMGRFGRVMQATLNLVEGVELVLVDEDDSLLKGYDTTVHGRPAEEETLLKAGVEQAAGLVAGTDNDINNLSTIMTARDLNPDVFVIARQDHKHHGELFANSGADIVAERHDIVARSMLTSLTAPLLDDFLAEMYRQDDGWSLRVLQALQSWGISESPDFWVVELGQGEGQALVEVERFGVQVTGSVLGVDPRQREQALPCTALLLRRLSGESVFLPDQHVPLMEGDQVLYAGLPEAKPWTHWLLSDALSLYYAATGHTLPRSWLGRVWHRRRLARG